MCKRDGAVGDLQCALFWGSWENSEVFWSRNSLCVYAKGFSSHPVPLPLFPGMLGYMWPNEGQFSHAQQSEATPSDSYFPKM